MSTTKMMMTLHQETPHTHTQAGPGHPPRFPPFPSCSWEGVGSRGRQGCCPYCMVVVAVSCGDVAVGGPSGITALMA